MSKTNRVKKDSSKLIINEKLKKNINKDYMFSFLRSFDLTSGVWMLYLAYRGLSLFEIGLMESIYHLSSFMMEIPTGMIADIYGRKTSRSLGRIANILSTLMMILSNDVMYFAIGFILQALGNNLESGAGEALVYDSMKENHEEENFMKIKGRQEFFFQLARSMALLVGGYFATLDYAYVYKVAIVISAVSFFQSLSFVEPNMGKVDLDESAYKTFKNQFVNSVNVIKNDMRIAFFILSTEAIATFVTTEYFYIQNYLKSIGRNEFQIGILLSFGAAASIIAGLNTHRIEKKFKFSGILYTSLIVSAISFWTITFKGMTEVSMVIITMSESVLFIATSDYINKLIPSEQRATVLSFQSMAFSFYMILLFPVVGKIGDLYGLINSFRVIAIISTITILFIAKIYSNNKMQKK
ncbi:MAG: MFS transporter [Acidaminobacteraceae bacterium]